MNLKIERRLGHMVFKDPFAKQWQFKCLECEKDFSRFDYYTVHMYQKH